MSKEGGKPMYDTPENLENQPVMGPENPANTQDWIFPTSDADHLRWIHDRLTDIHKEDRYYDYMWRLRGVIERLDRLDGRQGAGEGSI